MADAFFQSLGALRLPILFLGLALGTVVVLGGFTELPLLVGHPATPVLLGGPPRPRTPSGSEGGTRTEAPTQSTSTSQPPPASDQSTSQNGGREGLDSG